MHDIKYVGQIATETCFAVPLTQEGSRQKHFMSRTVFRSHTVTRSGRFHLQQGSRQSWAAPGIPSPIPGSHRSKPLNIRHEQGKCCLTSHRQLLIHLCGAMHILCSTMQALSPNLFMDPAGELGELVCLSQIIASAWPSCSVFAQISLLEDPRLPVTVV